MDNDHKSIDIYNLKLYKDGQIVEEVYVEKIWFKVFVIISHLLTLGTLLNQTWFCQ